MDVVWLVAFVGVALGDVTEKSITEVITLNVTGLNVTSGIGLNATSSTLNATEGLNVTTVATTASTCDVNQTDCLVSTSNVETTQQTKKSSMRTRTETPTTTPMPETLEEEFLEDSKMEVCTCNLQESFCDINCCCDPDCTHDNKLVFKTCKKEPDMHRDTSFCQFMDYIYVNNTPYLWEVDQNGLFCIARSNLPPQYSVQKKDSIEDLEDAQIQKQDKYEWADVHEESEVVRLNSSEKFAFGSNVWVLKNHTLELFQLPDSFITNACLTKKKIKFLQNYKSKCAQTWIDENNPSLHPQSYFKNISFVRAPKLFNVSLFERGLHICPNNACLPIEAKLCAPDFEHCSNVTNITTSCRLKLSTNELSCFNLAKKAKYTFYHDGVSGFSKIELRLVLSNISHFYGEDLVFLQEFSVGFFWANSTFDYSTLKSGNPGYVALKPVLVGTVNGTGVARSPYDVSENFLVLPANKNGRCVLNNQTNFLVKFGYNTITKCRISDRVNVTSAVSVKASVAKNATKNNSTTVINVLNATNSCREVQKTIFGYWPLARNFSGVNKVVGSFGNANESIPSDWVKILSNKPPVQMLNETGGNFTDNNSTLLCNLTTSLRIEVFHARVDYKTLHNQEKVLGVVFHFPPGKLFRLAVANNQTRFEILIREEVMFFDITSEKIQKYVDPPKFTITLPHDFFYPFVKVDNGGSRMHADFSLLGSVLFYLISMRRVVCVL